MRDCLIVRSVVIAVAGAVLAGCGTPAAPAPPVQTVPLEVGVTVDVGTRYQVMQGYGAALAFYIALLSKHPQSDQIYQALFADLGLQILRVANWYQVETQDNVDQTVAAVQGARAATGGHGPLVLMSSWSPPASLKSTGQTKNGGTLHASATGGYDYAGFGQWWATSLAAYQTAGLVPDYISLQNEPDFMASWESCLFDPSESATRAGYDQALDAVTTALAGSGVQPKVVGPESSGIAGSRVENYVAALSAAGTIGQLDVVAHHLYNGGNGNAPASFIGEMASLSDLAASLGKPLWMTEYSPSAGPDMFNTAWLIQNSVAIEGVSAYVYWELVWPPPSTAGQTPGGLVTISGSTWTINDTYYAVRHFSKWIDVGWQRVGAAAAAGVIQPSAFASPDGQSLTVVLLNSDTAVHQVTVDAGGFAYTTSAVYRTSGTDERTSPLGPLAGPIMMPSRSIVTVTFGP